MKDETWSSQASASVLDDAPTPDECIVVKKYANRRLYNTALSSYITLDDLGAMVRSGQDFVVQDAKTGADLTHAVLTQIIFEQEMRDGPLLPVSFLRQLIRLYGDTLQGFVPGYLDMTMSAFERNQETFRAHLERSFGATPGFPQLDAMVRANFEMFRQAAGMFTTFAAQNAATASSERGQADADAGAEDQSDARDAEIEELRKQLAAMQKRVDEMASG